MPEFESSPHEALHAPDWMTVLAFSDQLIARHPEVEFDTVNIILKADYIFSQSTEDACSYALTKLIELDSQIDFDSF